MKKSNRVGKAYALNYELYCFCYRKVRDEWLLGAGMDGSGYAGQTAGIPMHQ